MQSRKYNMTINNPLPKGLTHEQIKNLLLTLKSLAYYCMSDEIANSHHTHIYVYFSSPVRFTTLKKRFPQAHIEKAYGTSCENRDYVFKEGKWTHDAKKRPISQIPMRNGANSQKNDRAQEMTMQNYTN